MSKQNKATVDKLNSLHDKYADYLIECLDSGEELSSGTLAAIGAYLKTNDITVDITESSPAQNLTFKLKSLIEADNKKKEAM